MQPNPWARIAMLPFVIAACASPPLDGTRNARDALLDAHNAGALEYATSEFRAAEASMAELSSELDTQARRLPPFRSYERAEFLATVAFEAAREATVAAESNKELTHRRVRIALRATRASLSSARTSLRELSEWPGDHPELTDAETEIGVTAGTLDEATALFDNGRYLQAAAIIAPALASALATEHELLELRSRIPSP